MPKGMTIFMLVHFLVTRIPVSARSIDNLWTFKDSKSILCQKVGLLYLSFVSDADPSVELPGLTSSFHISCFYLAVKHPYIFSDQVVLYIRHLGRECW